MRKYLLLAFLIFIFGKINAQRISVLNADGLGYTEIKNEEILNNVYKLSERPTGLTFKVNSAVAFTTIANDGKHDAIVGTPVKSKSGDAAGGFVVNSATPVGTFTSGTELDDSHQIKVKATVAAPGFFTIYSNVVDGVMFYASGYFDRPNPNVDVVLKGIGIPLSSGTKKFAIHFGKKTIDVNVTFAGSAQTPAVTQGLSIADITTEFKEGTSVIAKAAGTVKVTTAGFYTIFTAPKNGVFFFKAGQFTATGDGVAVEVPMYGTPVKEETTKLKFTGLGDIDKEIKVVGMPPDHFLYSIPEDVNKVEFADPKTSEKYTVSIGKNITTTPPGEAGGGDNFVTISRYEDYIHEKYGEDNLILTPYGLLINHKIDNEKYLYGGPNYVHLFFDELGNSIITSVPQGIPEMQYVVHLIYQSENNGKQVTYGIKPTRGSFLGGNRIENNRGSVGELNATDDVTLREYTLVIKTSDTDIDFDIYRFENGVQMRRLAYTITMTNTYTANISVGLLNTDLKNPSFSIVTDPKDAALKIAKQEEAKNRGFVTIFATLYASPITNYKYYRDKKRMRKGTSLSRINNPVADFQRHSKDYLYMRPVWERIYPTIGVGVSDKAFQNLFFGLNWEFARGASFFFGGHYGKVNVFNAPDDFTFQETNLTDDEFNLYKNVDWDLGWAFGASVDFAILGNLFK